MKPARVLLVDPNDATRETAARRLRAQGYEVDGTSDPVLGADMALRAPPAALVADLWMPTISGVQLCRLLRSETGTAHIGIVLAGDGDDPRNRFWADRAGADGYVQKRRTGDLVRALHKTLQVRQDEEETFFFQVAENVHIRDRLARHLDTALYESVIAGEVRSLAGCGSFEGLFDRLAQLVAQLTRYRWLALSSGSKRLAIHHASGCGDVAEREARQVLTSAAKTTIHVEDEDAATQTAAAEPLVETIRLETAIGQIALSAAAPGDPEADANLLRLLATELSGPLRITALMEESQLLASTDALTGLSNRRAFSARVVEEISRCHRHGYALSLAVIDVDHFKTINDEHGHAAGDAVLAALGETLRSDALRRTDQAGRWGGEEFVLALLSTPIEGAMVACERIRRAIAEVDVRPATGVRIPVTASIGVAALHAGEKLEGLVSRADRAMYASKMNGRNRVTAGDGAGMEVVDATRGSAASLG